MLTPKQQELLLYINSRLVKDGISPSFEEMKDAVGIRSKSGIHRMIKALEERRFLRRLPYRARALEILRLPPGPDGAMRALPGGVNTMITPAGTGFPSNDNTVILPLHGRIAAGTPIEALRDQSGNVEVPAGIVGARNCYALEIEGDSMTGAGILDGDTVIVEHAETAENGEIVVALIDEQEATLKRLRRMRGTTALEAANPLYETRSFDPGRVRIQGRLIGLMRRY